MDLWDGDEAYRSRLQGACRSEGMGSEALSASHHVLLRYLHAQEALDTFYRIFPLYYRPEVYGRPGKPGVIPWPDQAD